ncbi:response regulator [Sphingorhabdus sp.]|uniref:response regulator n=1 Tax=Sphingorhabdus sp. TaxID=1902408 RepID=UPI00391AF0E8
MNLGRNLAQQQADAAVRAPVLIVEDEFLLRLMLSNQLREHGFDVIEASSADEALTMLSAPTPCLIVTDVRMPGNLNGIDLLSRVRETHPKLPVILVSGHLTGIEITDGYTQFMPKPYAHDALLQKIEVILRTT